MGLIDRVGSFVMKSRMPHLEYAITHPIEMQERVLKDLLKQAKNTEYGRRYKFSEINFAHQFENQVPVVSYEDLEPYINRLLQGESNLLWHGKTRWFAKSSGTTGSRSKLIPVTKEGLEECHFRGGRDMLALYLHNHPSSKIFSGKNLSIGGSQVNNFAGNTDVSVANISAIVMKNLPMWAQLKRTPGLKVTMMNNWEEKVKKIVEITTKQNVTCLAGSPMWMLLLLQQITREGHLHHIQDIWPNLEVFFHGSVSFSPYKQLFKELDRDNSLHYQEIYNATEGFFAIQDQVHDPALMLMPNYGIYYEFIPEKDFDNPYPTTIPLSQVETGKYYSIVISTNSGLWRYKIGDTIKFVSTSPYRFLISGRTKHCINVFGEDLFAEQADKALNSTCEKTGCIVQDFTVAPYFYDMSKKGYHEWLIEFVRSPENLREFINTLDKELCKLNEDYAEKRKEDIAIERPIVREVPHGTFYQWLKSNNKLGGQHKIPRLSNSRLYLEEILEQSKRLTVVQNE